MMEHIGTMSVEEKNLLRKAWAVLRENINELGRDIFEMIFAQSPDTKTLFPFMKLSQHKSDKVMKEIEFHGLRFMQIIETTVNALDRPESIEPILDNLGRRHGRLAENRGFSPHHWSVFIECSLYHFRNVMSHDNTFTNIAVIDRLMILWRILLKAIIKRMKIGLKQDLRNRRAHRENTSDFESLTLSSQSNNSRRALDRSSSLFESSDESLGSLENSH